MMDGIEAKKGNLIFADERIQKSACVEKQALP